MLQARLPRRRQRRRQPRGAVPRRPPRNDMMGAAEKSVVPVPDAVKRTLFEFRQNRAVNFDMNIVISIDIY